MKKPFLPIVLALSLSGCDWIASMQAPAGPEGDRDPEERVDLPPDPMVASRLADAAERAADASMAAAEVAIAVAGPDAAGGYSVPAGIDLPPELKRRYSVSWTGPMAPLLRTLSMEIGYAFRVEGPAPAAPLTIAIHREHEPAWRIIRDIGLSVSNAATVILNPNEMTVLLRHGWPRQEIAPGSIAPAITATAGDDAVDDAVDGADDGGELR